MSAQVAVVGDRATAALGEGAGVGGDDDRGAVVLRGRVSGVGARERGRRRKVDTARGLARRRRRVFEDRPRTGRHVAKLWRV